MMAMIALRTPAPRAAVITMARMTVGKASMRSVIRMTASSTRPPRKPAMLPSRVPSTSASRTAATPTGIESRAP